MSIGLGIEIGTFWSKKLETEYRSITESGWYYKMYQIMVATSGNAVSVVQLLLNKSQLYKGSMQKLWLGIKIEIWCEKQIET